MDDELRLHLELRAADLVRSGLTDTEARRRARLEFGNVEAYQERCREARGLNLVDATLQDGRYALRSFRKSPALTLSIVATLTLAIGATTALFSVVNGVVLRRLPYPSPDRLVVLGSADPGSRVATWPASITSSGATAATRARASRRPREAGRPTSPAPMDRSA
jgi:putative ABC transport system permease protein